MSLIIVNYLYKDIYPLTLTIKCMDKNLGLSAEILEQGFPNWGTRTPGGTREEFGGYATGFSKYFDFD